MLIVNEYFVLSLSKRANELNEKCNVLRLGLNETASVDTDVSSSGISQICLANFLMQWIFAWAVFQIYYLLVLPM